MALVSFSDKSEYVPHLTIDTGYYDDFQSPSEGAGAGAGAGLPAALEAIAKANEENEKEARRMASLEEDNDRCGICQKNSRFSDGEDLTKFVSFTSHMAHKECIAIVFPHLKATIAKMAKSKGLSHGNLQRIFITSLFAKLEDERPICHSSLMKYCAVDTNTFQEKYKTVLEILQSLGKTMLKILDDKAIQSQKNGKIDRMFAKIQKGSGTFGC